MKGFRVHSVRIVILSFNTAELTRACVDTVLRETSGLPVEVVVVDNASVDGSLELLRPIEGIRLIENAANLGFGNGMNQGTGGCTSEAILFLNTDVVFERESFVRAVDCLFRGDDVGMVGIALEYENGFRFTHFSSASPLSACLEHAGWIPIRLTKRWVGEPFSTASSAQEVPAPLGAFLLVRREPFEAVGGFDPGFFLYKEEHDLSARLRKAGWRVWVEPAARMVHYGSRSTDPGKVQHHLIASQRRYLRKHCGWGWYILGSTLYWFGAITGSQRLLRAARARIHS